MPEHASSERIETSEIISVRKRLLSDFRLSFRYSGSEKNQHMLFAAIILRLQHDGYSPELLLETAQDIIFEDWLRKAKPPVQHQGLEEGHVERETLNEVQKFIALMETACQQQDDLELYSIILGNVRDDLIEKDILYLSDGRPERKSHDARYASFVRDHILMGKPTGSKTFNKLFSDLKIYMLHFPSTRSKLLAAVWQYRHKEDFFPEDFLEAAHERGTLYLFHKKGENIAGIGKDYIESKKQYRLSAGIHFYMDRELPLNKLRL